MARLCFDSGGCARPQVALEYELCSSLTGDRFAYFAAANLGYVAVHYGRDRVRLWFRPSRVSELALTEVVHWLFEWKPTRVALTTYVEDWNDRVLPLNAAVAYLCESSASISPQQVYSRKRVGEEVIAAEPTMQGLLEFWQEMGHLYCPERYERMSQTLLGRRLFVIELKEQRLFFRYAGMAVGRRTIADKIPSNTLVEALPDEHYALNTAVSYRDALARNGSPSIEYVSAYLRSSERPEAYIEYLRLLLPCSSSDGNKFLLGTSVVQPTIHPSLKVG